MTRPERFTYLQTRAQYMLDIGRCQLGAAGFALFPHTGCDIMVISCGYLAFMLVLVFP